jgi:hypothetical protein
LLSNATLINDDDDDDDEVTQRRDAYCVWDHTTVPGAERTHKQRNNSRMKGCREAAHDDDADRVAAAAQEEAAAVTQMEKEAQAEANTY